jgi:hypothetical protein
VRRPRFTDKEWDAIATALSFIECGEDPWESDAPDDDFSPTFKAVKSALAKLARARVTPPPSQ